VPEMVTCIRLCLNCADVCTAAAAVISRQAAYDASVTRPLLETCAAICRTCGDECERHASMHAHCRVCGEACRVCGEACRVCGEACRPCEQACRELLRTLLCCRGCGPTRCAGTWR
jgi:Domain of Unknown Function (DUF326)